MFLIDSRSPSALDLKEFVIISVIITRRTSEAARALMNISYLIRPRPLRHLHGSEKENTDDGHPFAE